jgi:hypothetical protein
LWETAKTVSNLFGTLPVIPETSTVLKFIVVCPVSYVSQGRFSACPKQCFSAGGLQNAASLIILYILCHSSEVNLLHCSFHFSDDTVFVRCKCNSCTKSLLLNQLKLPFLIIAHQIKISGNLNFLIHSIIINIHSGMSVKIFSFKSHKASNFCTVNRHI